MKKVRIRVTPLEKTAKEKERAKLTEKWLNAEYETYQGVVSAVVLARRYFEITYATSSPSRIWDRILEEVVLLRFKKRGKEKNNTRNTCGNQTERR